MWNKPEAKFIHHWIFLGQYQYLSKYLCFLRSLYMQSEKSKSLDRAFRGRWGQRRSVGQNTTVCSKTIYSRVRNKRNPKFINFWNFFQALWSYYGLKRDKFYCISLHILRGYIYSFCQTSRATFIPDTRVLAAPLNYYVSIILDFFWPTHPLLDVKSAY